MVMEADFDDARNGEGEGEAFSLELVGRHGGTGLCWMMLVCN
jgi:hypothetical protein